MKRYLASLSGVFVVLILGAVIVGGFFLNRPGRSTGEVTTMRSNQSNPVAQAADGPLNGSFAGTVALAAAAQGVFSDTTQSATPQELGEIDLGLLLKQSGSDVTGYVDLSSTLVVTGEHIITATPIAPTPLPGTPDLQPVDLAVGPMITGTFDGTTLMLTSERTEGTSGGRAISRQFQLTATLETNAATLILRGIYRETLWDYSPQPLTVIGQVELIQPIFVSQLLNTPTPTTTATQTPVGQPTATATATQTPASQPTATATTTQTPVGQPTATATATQTPASQPTATPTATPTTQPPSGVTVTGLVYDDKNSNGSQDGGEPGVAGAEVTLTSTNRDVAITRTDITNVAGVYTLKDVPAGQYSLQVKLLSGQNGTAPPPVTVNVPGSGPVTVPSVAVQTKTMLYLPSVQR